jgi:hypothetical protein
MGCFYGFRRKIYKFLFKKSVQQSHEEMIAQEGALHCIKPTGVNNGLGFHSNFCFSPLPNLEELRALAQSSLFAARSSFTENIANPLLPESQKLKLKTRGTPGGSVLSSMPTAAILPPATPCPSVDLSPIFGYPAYYAESEDEKNTLFPMEGAQGSNTAYVWIHPELEEDTLQVSKELWKKCKSAASKARLVSEQGQQGIKILSNYSIKSSGGDKSYHKIVALKMLGEWGEHRLLGRQITFELNGKKCPVYVLNTLIYGREKNHTKLVNRFARPFPDEVACTSEETIDLAKQPFRR